MSRTKEATAYLQVSVDTRRPWTGTAIVKNVTNRRPDVVAPGCIVVKVRLRIPVEAWEPFSPEAVIDVPAELVQRPIEVEAVEP